MNDISLILFDLDDTLFDYDTCWELGFRAAFATHPLTRDMDPPPLYETFLKHDAVLWRMHANGDISFPELRAKRFLNTMSDFGVSATEDQSECFHQLFITHHLDYIAPDEQVIATIASLSNHYRMGIVTNGGPEQWGKLKKLQLDPFFPPDTIFASDVLGCRKPDREIFDIALHHFDTAAEHAAFIGDSWEHDVVGSLHAGLNCIWLNRHNKTASAGYQPTATISSLHELPALLGVTSPILHQKYL